MKDVDLGEVTSIFHLFFWVALNVSAKQAKVLWRISEICLNPKSLLEQQKTVLFRKIDAHISSWSNDMEGHAKEMRGKMLRICEQNN